MHYALQLLENWNFFFLKTGHLPPFRSHSILVITLPSATMNEDNDDTDYRGLVRPYFTEVTQRQPEETDEDDDSDEVLFKLAISIYAINRKRWWP